MSKSVFQLPDTGETRNFQAEHEFRAMKETDDSIGTIVGYAAVFDSESKILAEQRRGVFVEVIKPGCFTKTIKDGFDTRAFFNHDPNQVLGRVGNGTVRLSQDKRGLHYEVDLSPNVSYARDLAENIRAGLITQSSFNFRAFEDNWDKRSSEGLRLREVRSARLNDVSPVSIPAYEAATASLRSFSVLAKDLGLPVEDIRSAFENEELDGILKGVKESSTDDRRSLELEHRLMKIQAELELSGF